MNEKESGIKRVPNVSPEEEKEILEGFRGLLEDQPFFGAEKEKTTEEKEAIRQIINFFPEFIGKYGGKPLNISPEVIHIIDESKLSNKDKELIKEDAGYYRFDIQKIMVLPQESKLKFLKVIVHELMHLQAFTSLSLKEKDIEGDVEPINAVNRKFMARRIGFGIFDKTNRSRYFRYIDEAVIEELTKRFDSNCFASIPYLTNEIKERSEFRQAVSEKNKEEADDIQSLVLKQMENGMREITYYGYSYSKERQKLRSLIKEIYEKNKDDFSSEEDVFDLFAKATMTGRLLPIARLIEKTYGKGSFRKLGEDTEAEAKE